MVKATHRLGWLILLVGAAILSGCTGCAKEIVLDAPMVERDPVVTREPTLLEKFQKVSRLCEAAKLQVASLRKELASETKARRAAETELTSLRERASVLERKARELAELRVRHEEAQETLFELGKNVREIRSDLLKERLIRIKQEQTIVSLKIENAKARRKSLLENKVAAREASKAKEQE